MGWAAGGARRRQRLAVAADRGRARGGSGPHTTRHDAPAGRGETEGHAAAGAAWPRTTPGRLVHTTRAGATGAERRTVRWKDR